MSENNTKMLSDTDWVVVHDDSDLPKYCYDVTHRLYLCILESGKTLVCKYVSSSPMNGVAVPARWENASYWRDNLSRVVAYKEIHIPDNILALCIGSGFGRKKVEYFDGLH